MNSKTTLGERVLLVAPAVSAGAVLPARTSPVPAIIADQTAAKPTPPAPSGAKCVTIVTRFVPLVALCVVLLLVAAPVRAETARVAVLDFSVAGASSDRERWNWARGGTADLVQIQLQQRGVELLDRDWIQSVLKEQRLAQGGMTRPDQFKIAKLLNAQFLVSGRVIPLEGDRLRVEANVFSVEAIESVVAAKGEGVFPKDISVVVETVAEQIAAGLKNRAVFIPPSQRAPAAPKPESLIMFYRGLDAANNQPARAVAYFMNAAVLDKDFTVPLLWEIKAYEMAGLTNHAAVRREEIADVLKPLGLTTMARDHISTASAKPVIAILAPQANGGSTIDAAALGAELARALLANGQVRVFAPEGIGAAVAEQDLKLSELFDNQFAPRYGRWLVSDGLLQCRVNAADTNQVVVELSLTDPVTASVGSRVKQFGPLVGLSGILRSATDDLLARWTHSPASVQPDVVVQDDSTNTAIDDGVAELRPIYRNLAAALAGVQREPDKREAHLALANAFAVTGRPRLAAIEIERSFESMDIHAPRADMTFYETYRGLGDGQWPASGAVQWMDRQLIENLIAQLLEHYPDSLAAGCLRYTLALKAWQAKSWPEAIAQAAQSRRILRALITQYDRKAKTDAQRGDGDCEVAAATYFLEGDSLIQLERADEARAVFRDGLAFMNEYQVRDFCLPYAPTIGDFFGPVRVYGYGGDRPGNRTRIEQALAGLNGVPMATNTAPTPAKPTLSSEPDSPGVIWFKRADAALQSGQFSDALRSYAQALAEGATLAQCGGVRTALAELALDRNRDHAVEEAERCRVEFGLPPVTVTWGEWFAVGQKHQTGRDFDLEKAVAAYKATLDFLEHPERSGQYWLVTEPGWRWKALRWGAGIGQVDLHWGGAMGARWNNAAYQLAQCLIELGWREEAARWLRHVALDVGGDDMPLYKSAHWFGASYTTVKLGVLASDQLKELHASLDQPRFGEADGPYRTPSPRPRANISKPLLPAIAPGVMQALTNALARSGYAANDQERLATLNEFAKEHGPFVVPAVLTLLPMTGEAKEASGLVGLLERNATIADAPWIVAACRTNWRLIPLANRLDPDATAAALFAEWRVLAVKNFIPPDLIHAVANARVRPMFAPVLEQISGKWVNHHMVVFVMDRVVKQEQSEELTAAYRDALGSCLRLKLEQNDRYELPRISQIALRYGVPEAVEATLLCEESAPDKLRERLAPFLDLPAEAKAALVYLRAQGSRWEWNPRENKFTPLTEKQP